MRDRVRVSLKQLTEAAERAKTALPLQELFGVVPGGLCGGEEFALFAKCVRKQICVDGVRLFNGKVRMVFVKSWFVNGGFSPS